MFIRSVVGFCFVVSSLSSLGCTDEGEADSSSSSAGVGGASAVTGTGAADVSGGGGSGGGQGGEGGSGGSAVRCLDDSVADDFFTLNGDDLCVVDVWTATGLDLAPYGVAPTWGSHGGLLTFQATSSTDLVISRWADAGGGALQATTQNVTVPGVPAGAFWGTTAVEMTTGSGDGCDPTPMVVAAWTDAATDGALVTIDPEGASEGSVAAGVFGLAVSGTRLFYTGLSEVGGPNDGVGALYAADVQPCGGFVTAGDVDAWGMFSGPATSDALGNVFAVQTDFGAGTQELRGFADADVGAGDPATVGVREATQLLRAGAEVGLHREYVAERLAERAPTSTRPRHRQ